MIIVLAVSLNNLILYFQPMRRSKAKTKEAFEKLVQDAVEAEPISVDFYLNSPSTSSTEMYSIVDEILDEQEELASVRQNTCLKYFNALLIISV